MLAIRMPSENENVKMMIKNGEANAGNQRINKISLLLVLTHMSPSSSFPSLNPSTQASSAISLLAAASRQHFETRNASLEDKHEAIDCTIRVFHTVSPALPDLLLK